MNMFKFEPDDKEIYLVDWGTHSWVRAPGLPYARCEHCGMQWFWSGSDPEPTYLCKTQFAKMGYYDKIMEDRQAFIDLNLVFNRARNWLPRFRHDGARKMIRFPYWRSQYNETSAEEPYYPVSAPEPPGPA